MKVKVFLGDMIGCHIWHSGWYEPHFVEAIKPYLTPEVTFFDLGANIGQYTLLSAPLVQEVHSFEPFARTYKLLEWNVQHNHLANVHLNQLAISDQVGEATIYEGSATNTGGYSLRGPGAGADRQYLIRTTTLDQYVFALLSKLTENRPTTSPIKGQNSLSEPWTQGRLVVAKRFS